MARGPTFAHSERAPRSACKIVVAAWPELAPTGPSTTMSLESRKRARVVDESTLRSFARTAFALRAANLRAWSASRSAENTGWWRKALACAGERASATKALRSLTTSSLPPAPPPKRDAPARKGWGGWGVGEARGWGRCARARQAKVGHTVARDSARHQPRARGNPCVLEGPAHAKPPATRQHRADRLLSGLIFAPFGDEVQGDLPCVHAPVLELGACALR